MQRSCTSGQDYQSRPSDKPPRVHRSSTCAVPGDIPFTPAPNTTAQELQTPTRNRAIGNLIGMPIAIGIGRRSVLLGSSVVLVVAAALCAAAKSYEWQLGCHLILGLAAGQSETSVPLITQDIFFLHERGRGLMLQQAIQNVMSTVWVLFASPIAGAIRPQWWYGLDAILAGVEFLLAFFLLPETKYEHLPADYQEVTSSVVHNNIEEVKSQLGGRSRSTQHVPLDFDMSLPRIWKSDMRPWTGGTRAGARPGVYCR